MRITLDLEGARVAGWTATTAAGWLLASGTLDRARGGRWRAATSDGLGSGVSRERLEACRLAVRALVNLHASRARVTLVAG